MPDPPIFFKEEDYKLFEPILEDAWKKWFSAIARK